MLSCCVCVVISLKENFNFVQYSRIPYFPARAQKPLTIMSNKKQSGRTPPAKKKGFKHFMLFMYEFAFSGKVSGRQDASVMMRNGRGRSMTVPALVRNAYTTLQRSSFSSFSAGWRALTLAQQTTWNSAAGWTKTDRFGHVINIVGKALYIAVNRALSNVGVSPLTSVAALAGTTPPVTFAPNGGLVFGHFKVTFTVSPIPAGTAWLCMATAPQSAGIFRPGSSKYRIFSFMDAAVATGVDKSATYNTKFGVPVVGQKVFFKIIAVNKSTGEQGAPFQGSYVVTA